MPYVRLHIDFDQFADEDLADHLRSCGYKVTGGKKADHTGADESLTIEEDELEHISTLALCGQTEAARELVISRVSEAIGRPL